MSDPAFRASQEADRYAAHVAPVNELVDSLRDESRGWMPHVAPLHGGVSARVLSVLRDPGPATQAGSGSGFRCIENDDPTAERQLQMFTEVGVTPADITPWNACPWYINAAPKVVCKPAPLHRPVGPYGEQCDEPGVWEAGVAKLSKLWAVVGFEHHAGGVHYIDTARTTFGRSYRVLMDEYLGSGEPLEPRPDGPQPSPIHLV